jgi:tRNA (guanine-N7-)-methyltransferase
MGKNKQKKIEENKTFSHLFQPSPEKMFTQDFDLKGKWNSDFFKNDHPIILEVGCGKGEYTVGLAERHPENNYIGIDIKGPRLWRGCKTVQELSLKNVAFIRNKVEFLNSFFAENEISEIWITFPDPQAEKAKKRLTSARFLEIYSKILIPGNCVNLKTDSVLLFSFTQRIIKQNSLETVFSTNDLYASGYIEKAYDIKTHYEKKFLQKNLPINFLKFSLNTNQSFINPK